MERITAFQGIPDDVAARVTRSRFLYEGGHRYIVLMEESVLRFSTADPDAMRGQLRHLLAVMPLASRSLGITSKATVASVTRGGMELDAVHEGGHGEASRYCRKIRECLECFLM